MSEPIIRTFKADQWTVIGNAAKFVLTAIKECLTREDGKGHYWYLDDASLSGTGFTLDASNYVTGLIIKNQFNDYFGNQNTQKISFRTFASGANLAVALHPAGNDTIINSLPTSQTSLIKNVAGFNGAQQSYSGELRILGGKITYTTNVTNVYSRFDATSSSISTSGVENNPAVPMTGWIIELPDSISIIFKMSGYDIWCYALHCGKIFEMTDPSDVVDYEGSGILVGQYNAFKVGYNAEQVMLRSSVGLPRGSLNSDNSNGDTTSLFYVGNNSWRRPVLFNPSFTMENVNNQPKFELIKFNVYSSLFDSTYPSITFLGGLYGSLKYIRFGPDGSTLNEVIDSSNVNKNISWIRQYRDSNTTYAHTNVFHIWKRDVSPTTAQ